MADTADGGKYFSLEIYLTVLAVLFTMWVIVHVLGYFMGSTATAPAPTK